MDNLGLLIFAVIALPIVLAALYFLVRAFAAFLRAGASRGWSETTGQVIYSGLQPRLSTDVHPTTSLYPVVVYTYHVNGQQHESRRIDFGPELGRGVGTSGGIRKQIARYHEGSPVRVYYDPNNPAQAVLERSAGSSSRVFVVIALSLVATLVIIYVFIQWTMQA